MKRLKSTISIALSLLLLICALSGSIVSADAASDSDRILSAAKYIRSQMKQRATTIEGMTYFFETDHQAAMDAIIDRIFDYTDDPEEGDYLEHSYISISYGYAYTRSSPMRLSYELEIEYRTTLEQEQELSDAVPIVLSSLGLDGLSEAEKARKIYEYVASHVSYDWGHYTDPNYIPQFTAYAALINGTAVCEGYSLLFYRLAHEAGLSSRIISGNVPNGAHAWNTVKIGSKYYYLDITFASTAKNNDAYFLKGSRSLSDHTPDSKFLSDEYLSRFPISEEDYSGGEELPTGGSVAQPETSEPTEFSGPSESETTTTQPSAASSATEPTEEGSAQIPESESPSESGAGQESESTEFTQTPPGVENTEPYETDEPQPDTEAPSEGSPDDSTAVEAIPTLPAVEHISSGNALIKWTYYPREKRIVYSNPEPGEFPEQSGECPFRGEIEIIELDKDFTGFKHIDPNDFPALKYYRIPEKMVVLGDVNMDGKIDITDATAIAKHLVMARELIDPQLESADVSGDGFVDVRDITLIQQFLAELISAFHTR